MLRRLLDAMKPARKPTAPRSTTALDAQTTGPPAQPARAYTGSAQITYAPEDDSDPDPGEVVWAWIPYEEDPTTGKDRPVVVVGMAPGGSEYDLVVVPLTSRDHGDDPDFFPVGSGAWDRERRPSFVRLDFAYAVEPAGVRREGATLDRSRYMALADALRHRHGWT